MLFELSQWGESCELVTLGGGCGGAGICLTDQARGCCIPQKAEVGSSGTFSLRFHLLAWSEFGFCHKQNASDVSQSLLNISSYGLIKGGAIRISVSPFKDHRSWSGKLKWVRTKSRHRPETAKTCVEGNCVHGGRKQGGKSRAKPTD